MASAAAEKKCPWLFQPGSFCPTSRRYASCTRAVAWRVWPGDSLASRRAASSAVRRRPGAGVARRPGVALFDVRENLGEVIHESGPAGDIHATVTTLRRSHVAPGCPSQASGSMLVSLGS